MTFWDDRTKYRPRNKSTPQSRHEDYLEAKAWLMILAFAITFALGLLIGEMVKR